MSSKNQKYSTKIKKIVNFIIKNVHHSKRQKRTKLIKPYFEIIVSVTSFLEKDCSLSERFYCILNDIYVNIVRKIK